MQVTEMRRAVGLMMIAGTLTIGCPSTDEGVEGSPCDGNGTCNAGLVCLSHLCVNPNGGPDVPGVIDTNQTDVPVPKDVPVDTDAPATTDTPEGIDILLSPDVPDQLADTPTVDSATADLDESDPGAADSGTTDPGTAPGIAVDWVAIPGGTFQMGAEAPVVNAVPVHGVSVPAFKMSRTEVTVAQFAACMAAGTCTQNRCLRADACVWEYQCLESAADTPKACVDWNESKAFCLWAGGRLCSEAEWEYAARNGAAGTQYPWGNTDATCAKGNFSADLQNCQSLSVAPVCSKPEGNDTWGVCDLAGNVWEWVEDNFHGYSKDHYPYTDAPTDGSAWSDDPLLMRVIRGGGFGENSLRFRGAARGSAHASDTGPTGGVRCCQ